MKFEEMLKLMEQNPNAKFESNNAGASEQNYDSIMYWKDKSPSWYKQASMCDDWIPQNKAFKSLKIRRGNL